MNSEKLKKIKEAGWDVGDIDLFCHRKRLPLLMWNLL